MKTNVQPGTSESNLDERVSFILEHLSAESIFLDKVIASCVEMQTILRDGRQPDSDEPAKDSRPIIAARIAELQTQLEREFEPIQRRRQKMLQVIHSIPLPDSAPRTASELARRVEEPQRGILNRLRNEIRAKFSRIQAICMGNQAVLVYTLDFYNRLLAGLSQQQVSSSGYDASGASTSSSITRLPGNIVRTHC